FLGVHLLERTAEIDLRLDPPRGAHEELRLNRELLRPAVNRVETAHGRVLRIGHTAILSRAPHRTPALCFGATLDLVHALAREAEDLADVAECELAVLAE